MGWVVYSTLRYDASVLMHLQLVKGGQQKGRKTIEFIDIDREEFCVLSMQGIIYLDSHRNLRINFDMLRFICTFCCNNCNAKITRMLGHAQIAMQKNQSKLHPGMYGVWKISGFLPPSSPHDTGHFLIWACHVFPRCLVTEI